MTNRHNIGAWVVLVATATLMLSLGHSMYLTLENNKYAPPVSKWYWATAHPEIIEQGQNLTVRIRRDKIRDDCPVLSFRSAVPSIGWPIEIPGYGWTGGTSEIGVLEYTYPTHMLPPGSYTLDVRLVYICPERAYIEEQPKTKFEVVDGTQTK